MTRAARARLILAMFAHRLLQISPVLALSLGAQMAAAEIPNELELLLHRAEQQITSLTPLRADIRATIDGLAGKTSDRAVLIVRNSPERKGEIDIYLEFRDSGVKALALGAQRFYTAAGKATLSTPIGETTWTIEDLLPFRAVQCQAIRIADLQPDQMTVICEPPDPSVSQYTLRVFRFDREKAVPERVLDYRESQTNLVKMRRDEKIELVGRSWRPTRIRIQDFKLNTRDVFELEWSQDPKFPPGIFDPETLGESSGIKFPD